jgi:hypothetical protein
LRKWEVGKIGIRNEEMIAIKSCPSKPETVGEALHKAGIEVDPAVFENLDKLLSFFLKRS